MNDHSEYNQLHYSDYTVLGHISSTGEHVVVDARTKNHESEKTSPRLETKKRKHPSRARTLLTVLITIFAFSLALFATDLLSGRSTLSQYVALFTGKENDGSMVFYAVYAMKTEDMALAYKNAASVRAEGGAGYVLKDGETHYVVLNVYADETDAKKVAEKVINYAVYTLRAPFLDTDSDAFSFMASTSDLYLDSYKILYEAANNLASGKYGKEDMLRAIEKHREKITAAQELYGESIRGKETPLQIEYKVFLAEIRGAFDNLITNSGSLVADARYYSVMILHSYTMFAQKYSKK